MKNTKVYSIEEIKNTIIPVLEPLGVEKIAVFGSYAKGKANINSDVDLLVKLPDRFDAMQYIEAENKIKKMLNKDIEVLEYRCIADYMKDSILSGSIVIYDKE